MFDVYGRSAVMIHASSTCKVSLSRFVLQPHIDISIINQLLIVLSAVCSGVLSVRWVDMVKQSDRRLLKMNFTCESQSQTEGRNQSRSLA